MGSVFLNMCIWGNAKGGFFPAQRDFFVEKAELSTFQTKLKLFLCSCHLDGRMIDMKKIISALVVTTIFFTTITSGAFAVDSGFTDISGHWAEETIDKWKERGVITGYPDGTFKPDNPVTRAELAKIITLAFDLQETGSLEYDDIDSSAWYYQYLEYAVQYIPVYPLPEGLSTNLPYRNNFNHGTNDGNGFLPATNAIRMHVAEALVEIKMDQENLEMELPDIGDIQKALFEPFEEWDYYNLFAMHGTVPGNVRRMFEYTWLARELDIMQGDSDGYFRPYGEITRAELLTMIYRIGQ